MWESIMSSTVWCNCVRFFSAISTFCFRSVSFLHFTFRMSRRFFVRTGFTFDSKSRIKSIRLFLIFLYSLGIVSNSWPWWSVFKHLVHVGLLQVLQYMSISSSSCLSHRRSATCAWSAISLWIQNGVLKICLNRHFILKGIPITLSSVLDTRVIFAFSFPTRFSNNNFLSKCI